jgi:hypothetical protein
MILYYYFIIKLNNAKFNVLKNYIPFIIPNYYTQEKIHYRS